MPHALSAPGPTPCLAHHQGTNRGPSASLPPPPTSSAVVLYHYRTWTPTCIHTHTHTHTQTRTRTRTRTRTHTHTHTHSRPPQPHHNPILPGAAVQPSNRKPEAPMSFNVCLVPHTRPPRASAPGPMECRPSRSHLQTDKCLCKGEPRNVLRSEDRCVSFYSAPPVYLATLLCTNPTRPLRPPSKGPIDLHHEVWGSTQQQSCLPATHAKRQCPVPQNHRTCVPGSAAAPVRHSCPTAGTWHRNNLPGSVERLLLEHTAALLLSSLLLRSGY